jgi:hypothetical protein
MIFAQIQYSSIKILPGTISRRYLHKTDCFATKLLRQDKGVLVCSFEEQPDSGGDQFLFAVGARRMFSTLLHVHVMFLAMRSTKVKDPRPIIVTTHIDNCPSTGEDGPTVTQLYPKLHQTMPNRRSCTSSSTVLATSLKLVVIAASHLLLRSYAEQTYLYEYCRPYTPLTFVISATLCAAPAVYQYEYCKLLTQPKVRRATSIQIFPHFSHPPYELYFTSAVSV